MAGHLSLRYLKELPKTLEVLCQEAAEEGFRFMDKLAKEWKTGRNRFDAPGEILLGAFLNSELVAVGGLNIDPYANDVGMARLRHLYVLKQARRQGVAAALVRRLLEDARKAGFSNVRLLTDTLAGASLYEALGFSRLTSPHGSHFMTLTAHQDGLQLHDR
jgi:GNAT superfamily N-acetyltransferase